MKKYDSKIDYFSQIVRKSMKNTSHVHFFVLMKFRMKFCRYNWDILNIFKEIKS